MAPKRVLIADDDANLVSALTLRFEQLGLDVQQADDAMAALTMVHTDPPNLIVIDVRMPAGNGLSVCEMLASDNRLPPIPVIVLTGASDPETIARCQQLGAHYVQKGCEIWERLRPIVCDLLYIEVDGDGRGNPKVAEPERANKRAQPVVLVVDDDRAVSEALRLKLLRYGVRVLSAFNGMQGFWMALKERPDVIIADYVMPEGEGNYLLGRLKYHPLTSDIPVIVVTGHAVGGGKNFALEREMYNLGAAAFFMKPFDFEALLAELREHIELPAWPIARVFAGSAAAAEN